MTTKHEVISAHRLNPAWTARDIAEFLGCLPEYVNATARRNNLRLPKAYIVRPALHPSVRLSDPVISALQEHAVVREITVSDLAKRLIETIARDCMVDAVLDDRRSA